MEACHKNPVIIPAHLNPNSFTFSVARFRAESLGANGQETNLRDPYVVRLSLVSSMRRSRATARRAAFRKKGDHRRGWRRLFHLSAVMEIDTGNTKRLY